MWKGRSLAEGTGTGELSLSRCTETFFCVTLGPRNLDIYSNEVRQASFLLSGLVKMGHLQLLNSRCHRGSPSHELPWHTHPLVPVCPVVTQACCFLKLAEPAICKDPEKPGRSLLRSAVCAVVGTLLLHPVGTFPAPPKSHIKFPW